MNATNLRRIVLCADDYGISPGVNEAIRLTQTTEFWVNSRLFIGFPLVALFMLLNLPITLKNVGKAE